LCVMCHRLIVHPFKSNLNLASKPELCCARAIHFLLVSGSLPRYRDDVSFRLSDHAGLKRHWKGPRDRGLRSYGIFQVPDPDSRDLSLSHVHIHIQGAVSIFKRSPPPLYLSWRKERDCSKPITSSCRLRTMSNPLWLISELH